MAFLIDTSAIIQLERSARGWSELEQRTGTEPVYISAIGWAELLAGVFLADAPSRSAARHRKLAALRTLTTILPFTPEIAEVWAECFSHLHRAGTPIPSNDLAIAATAKFHNCTLLVGSADEAHFRRVPGLTIVTL